MKRNIIISCIIFLFVVHIQAQTEEIFAIPRLRLGVELGLNNLFVKANKLPMIRENHSYYHYYDDYDYYGGFIPDGKNFTSCYLGVKPEYLVHKRVAVAAGVRFSFNKVVYDSDRDYFLWKLSESADGTQTNYVKIRNITQRNYYVSIPMEVKFFPREIDYPVRHYFVFGTAFNFRVTSNEEVSFKNSAMEKHESEVSDQIKGSSNFYGNLYLGFGIKIGKSTHPCGNIEFHAPLCVFYANDKPNSLVKMRDAIGSGLQLTFQLPLCKQHQLSYTVIND